MLAPIRLASALGLLPCILAGAVGCYPIPPLPESFEVALTAAQRETVDDSAGPAALAGGVWSIARVADASGAAESDGDAPPGPYGGLLSGMALDRPPAGERIFLAHFDDLGRMVEVTENRYFLAEFYGETVPVGGDWTPTTLPGVLFHSRSFGVQVGDRFGLAVVVQVRLLECYAGEAILYAWGSVVESALSGQFGYLLDFSDSLLEPLGTIADQYPFEGERLAE